MAYANNANNAINTINNINAINDNQDVANNVIDNKDKKNLYKIVKKIESTINKTMLNFYDNFYTCESNVKRHVLIKNVNNKYEQLFNAITNTGSDYKTTQSYEDHIKFTTFITSEMNMLE